MDAGAARWAERHHYAAPPDHLQQPNLLPHLQSQSQSQSHYYYASPAPNPNPNPTPIPAAGVGAPVATEAYFPNSYAGNAWHEGHHGGVGGSLQPGSSYYYPPRPVGAGGHDVALKEAVRQYGVDPALYGNAVAGSSNGLPRSLHSHARPAHQNYRVLHPAMKRVKKPPKGPAKVAQPVSCEVCKIKCSSQEDLKSHRQGKKHKSNLQKLQESITPKPSKPQKTTTSTTAATSVMGGTCVMPATSVMGSTCVMPARSVMGSTSVVPAISVMGSTSVVPAISVMGSTSVVPAISVSGTTSVTHTTSTAPATSTIPDTSTRPATSTTSSEKKEAPADDKVKAAGEQTGKMPVPASVEDLELKKQNVLKAGVAESEIRICTLCNVVVNSPLVFNHHITGQKHLAMVRKWQAAQSIMQQMDDSGHLTC